MEDERMTDSIFPRQVRRDPGLPAAQGLYSPDKEHAACGVGFVADMRNRKSHEMITMGLEILRNLDHRGAVGADPEAGDGCGMLVQIPHHFFAKKATELGFVLPAPGEYAIGALFLPRDREGRRIVEDIVEKMVAAEGQITLGWRDTPVDSTCLGESVRATEPVSRQIFIQRGPHVENQTVFERRLFLMRKKI
jgi:glutamate synthase (NADPH/NADH) large chain